MIARLARRPTRESADAQRGEAAQGRRPREWREPEPERQRSASARSGRFFVLIALVAVTASAQPAPSANWMATLERIVPGVVVLRVSVPRAFDTELPAYETATGFVVDAERGLILTNRHVVKPGPARAEALFPNDEEVALSAVYRDPVHDFGFYRYDPAHVQFMQPAELPLVPEHARVGTEIRVVGNDAGEKLSILAGTLARLDRPAPRYGRGRYNDFNTFYFQAASGTSGGSSGSPVIDIHGHVVALNAGGSRRASSSFYLPLGSVVRALELVRKGEPVPRGTIQTVLAHQTYDELRRLGLGPQTEAEVRRLFPAANGLLTVRQILPAGPADGALEVGDVLLRVDGEWVAGFAALEAALDARVGQTVAFGVERGGESVRVEVAVGDLHAITPSAYLEVGGAVLHPLSYQQARNYGVAIGGLYAASAGYMLSHADIPRQVVITAIDGRPVTGLKEALQQLAALPGGSRIPIRYFPLDDPKTQAVSVATLDRRWFPMRSCVRDDETGLWPCRPAPDPPAREALEPASTTFSEEGPWAARRLAPSLVMVDFAVPYRIDGVHGERFTGTGLVVDAGRGLVVVDRETVPIALGDVRVTFAASIEVPGEVVYIHPEHNLAFVSYDPELIGDTPVRSASFSSDELSRGDDVWLVGLSPRHELTWRRSEVSRIEVPALTLPNPPRFRETNIELLGLEDSTPTLGGVLADRWGRVSAFWASFAMDGDEGGQEAFFAGIPAARVQEVATPLSEGRSVEWRSLGAELEPVSLAKARSLGLPEGVAAGVSEREPRGRRLLSVRRLTAGTAAADVLEEGDLLLSLDGSVAPTVDEAEQSAQADRVGVSVLRDGEVLSLDLATQPLDGRGTDRFALWAGAVLQAPHRAIAAQKGISRTGVYVAWLWFGSPANLYGLRATRRIVAVDGTPVRDLDEFLAAVEGRADRAAVRLRTQDLDGTPRVVALKLDLEYWPTVEFVRGENGWQRVVH